MLHAALLGDELLDVEQHVGAQLNDGVAAGPHRLDRLGLVAAAVSRIAHPVVVLDGVNRLYDGADATYVYVNVDIVDELGRQIRVQFGLHLVISYFNNI